MNIKSIGVRPSIAVLIPCYNEEPTIAEVVKQFRAQLPEAIIYVFDNNSSDRTGEEARLAGATVIQEGRRGKGYVIQSMFRRVEADIYVLVDGDGELPPESVHTLIAPVLNDEADMVVGSRFDARRRAVQTSEPPGQQSGPLFTKKVLNAPPLAVGMDEPSWVRVRCPRAR